MIIRDFLCLLGIFPDFLFRHCENQCRQFRLCLENDLPVITPHSLRHWSVSLKLLLTGDIKSVQADSGQKNTQMVLDRYAHAFEAERKKMALTVEAELRKTAECSQNVSKNEEQKEGV